LVLSHHLKYSQLFKCHKVILGTASYVFERMFFGDFKEAPLGKDEPATLKNVPPATFDLAMRYRIKLHLYF